ncbi:MAG: hypothetical protein ONA90_07605, partial [candidate division KSB1 bacterium]|nr:hypothetical protein [candidate division KSB1 bacterium]
MRTQNPLSWLLIFAVAALTTAPMFAQDQPMPSTRPLAETTSPASATQLISSPGDVKSFWSMIQLGGGIGYLIIAVLAIGLFLALVRFFELFSDGRASRPLLRLPFATLPIEDMPRQIRPAANSWLGQLLLSLVNLYSVSGS